MPLEIVQVDAFTSRPFTGNPAAVCLLEEPPPEWWMQDLAREMNLSETAFLLRHEEGFDLRWFTPTTEVDLCGHATLASAHALWEGGHLEPDEPAVFHTRHHLLTARREGASIAMDFPLRRTEQIDPPDVLVRALGVAPLFAGAAGEDWLVEVEDEKVVRTLSPDLTTIATLPPRGIIVTSRPTSRGMDFVSRFFAPRVGVPEDPVTGSAHCALGPYWADKLEKEDLVGYQVSARGGTVGVRLVGDRVLLSGRAVTIFRAALLVSPGA